MTRPKGNAERDESVDSFFQDRPERNAVDPFADAGVVPCPWDQGFDVVEDSGPDDWHGSLFAPVRYHFLRLRISPEFCEQLIEGFLAIILG